MSAEELERRETPKGEIARRMAELLERLSKTPAIPWMYRSEAGKRVKEWRNA